MTIKEGIVVAVHLPTIARIRNIKIIIMRSGGRNHDHVLIPIISMTINIKLTTRTVKMNGGITLVKNMTIREVIVIAGENLQRIVGEMMIRKM